MTSSFSTPPGGDDPRERATVDQEEARRMCHPLPGSQWSDEQMSMGEGVAYFTASEFRIVPDFKRTMKEALCAQGHSWRLTWSPSPFLVWVLELALILMRKTLQWTKSRAVLGIHHLKQTSSDWQQRGCSRDRGRSHGSGSGL